MLSKNESEISKMGLSILKPILEIFDWSLSLNHSFEQYDCDFFIPLRLKNTL